MAVLASKTVNDQLVYFDNAYSYRWLDAIGPAVVKEILEGHNTPYAAANALAGWNTTLVNASTIANVAGATGGAIIITGAGAEHDGVNIQANGEAFYFASAWPCYFGVEVTLSEATQSDLWTGIAITDTSFHGALPTNGIYFSKVDGATAVDFTVRKGGNSTTIAGVHTMTTSAVRLEFYYDGTNVTAYVNGVEAGSIAKSNANFPNTEYLSPVLEYKDGGGAATTCTFRKLRAIQVQQ